jgi:hypothetical protein
MKLGYMFALSSAEEQAEMLNEAGRAARRTWQRAFTEDASLDSQCLAVVDELDADGKALIKRLASFIASDEGR